MTRRHGGLVVASQSTAADAGAAALAAGGTAADAAIAAALVLCVVDPANCGLGGYGGFMTYAAGVGAPIVVDFDTWVPDRVDPARFRVPGDDGDPQLGGRSIAPPNVVPGLLAAHAELGRLPLEQLVAPAARLAREGFRVTRDVERALVDHWQRTNGGAPGFAEIFYPAAVPPAQGELMLQPELAATLETLARQGRSAFERGDLVDAMCSAARDDDGFLEPADFAESHVSVGPPARAELESLAVYGPHPDRSGAGVLFGALARLAVDHLGSNRSRTYIEELRRALAEAWSERTAAAYEAAHTTTLCAADSEGALASLTFTHGSWFGSGIVAPGTGIVLNGGANLFARVRGGSEAVTNMAPLLLEEADGTRHAVGATGGPRIPGILLSAVVDVACFGMTLSEAIVAPHLAVRGNDGALVGEPAVLETAGGGLLIAPGDFGPAAGITLEADGGVVPAVDSRFEAAAAFA